MLFEQLNMYAKLQMVSRRQGRTLIALGSVLVGVQLLFLRREAMFAPVINDVSQCLC